MWARRVARGAAGAGITVGSVACLAKVRAKEPVPKFDSTKSRYDETTFYGRYQAMCDLTDPLDLFTTNAQLEEAKAKLESFRAGHQNYSDEELWNAQKTVKSMTHPVTGEVTFWPGRMSAFVVTNAPISMGMIIHGPTSPLAGAFWQWMNQSINVAINYVNRAGPEVEMSKLAISYGLAVATSCGLAVGLGKVIAANPVLQKFGLLMPYFALISASTANMLFTRWDEIQTGIQIFDTDEKMVGISANAGVQAVVETLVTRAYMVPVACLLIPPAGIFCVRKLLPAMMRNRLLASLTEGCIVAASIYLALPVCLAIQPQTMVIPREKLEPEYQALVDKHGKEVTHFTANKGL